MQKTIVKVIYDKRIKPFKIKTQRQINSFLRKRDFNKMAEMFKNCGWHWGGMQGEEYIPTAEQIREFVIEMINYANTGKFEQHYCGRILIVNTPHGFCLYVADFNP